MSPDDDEQDWEQLTLFGHDDHDTKFDHPGYGVPTEN